MASSSLAMLWFVGGCGGVAIGPGSHFLMRSQLTIVCCVWGYLGWRGSEDSGDPCERFSTLFYILYTLRQSLIYCFRRLHA
jgi:hypothetical protein